MSGSLAPLEISSVFEVGGWDTVIRGRLPRLTWDAEIGYGLEAGAAVEIKPALADEFPAVLRQIRARPRLDSPGAMSVILVIDRFSAEGATLAQVRQMFGFPIVTIAEIEAAQ